MKKLLIAFGSISASLSLTLATETEKPAPETVQVGAQAPAFKITDSAGKEVVLADLTKEGPVLVRLTCGCLAAISSCPIFRPCMTRTSRKG